MVVCKQTTEIIVLFNSGTAVLLVVRSSNQNTPGAARRDRESREGPEGGSTSARKVKGRVMIRDFYGTPRHAQQHGARRRKTTH